MLACNDARELVSCTSRCLVCSSTLISSEDRAAMIEEAESFDVKCEGRYAVDLVEVMEVRKRMRKSESVKSPEFE